MSTVVMSNGSCATVTENKGRQQIDFTFATACSLRIAQSVWRKVTVRRNTSQSLLAQTACKLLSSFLSRKSPKLSYSTSTKWSLSSDAEDHPFEQCLSGPSACCLSGRESTQAKLDLTLLKYLAQEHGLATFMTAVILSNRNEFIVFWLPTCKL